MQSALARHREQHLARPGNVQGVALAKAGALRNFLKTFSAFWGKRADGRIASALPQTQRRYRCPADIVQLRRQLKGAGAGTRREEKAGNALEARFLMRRLADSPLRGAKSH